VSASSEQPEAVVQACGHPLDTERDDARCGEFDRERDPVEVPANDGRRRRDAALGNNRGSAARARDTKSLAAPYRKTSSMSSVSSAGTSSDGTR
jgi:hypothetical protein